MRDPDEGPLGPHNGPPATIEESAAWAAHGMTVRSYVESLARGLLADPDETWTGAEIGQYLLITLDASDLHYGRLELPGETPTPPWTGARGHRGRRR